MWSAAPRRVLAFAPKGGDSIAQGNALGRNAIGSAPGRGATG